MRTHTARQERKAELRTQGETDGVKVRGALPTVIVHDRGQLVFEYPPAI
jgi:hypothetical protein